MGDATGTAAANLRLLQAAHLTPRRGRPDGQPRPPRPAHAPAPLNLDVIDHLEATRTELIDTAHRLGTALRPAGRDAADILDAFETSTAHLAGQQAQARDTILYRQSLEHAIAVGDHKTIRRIPCPACRCYGLLWRHTDQQAGCVNRFCAERQPGGRHATWTLAELAHHVIAGRYGRARTAT